MAVDTPSEQYKAMEKAGSWDLCGRLLGGTPSMREAKETLLPKEPDEDDDSYEVRLNRSFLHNAYDDTIEKYVARPFSRPAVWDVKNEDAKAAIEPVMSDMDGEGLHHQDFAKDFFRMMMRWNVATAFVGYPQVKNSDNITKEDVKADELRPINRILKTPNVIGWKTTKKANGVDKLIQIRVKEVHIEEEENWTQKVYDQIRVIDVDKWTLYRREKREGATVQKMEWVPQEPVKIQMDGETPDSLPTVTAYTNKISLMTGLPPFLNMAWTNLELWQSASDQKNILRFDRLGILFGSGFTDSEKEDGLKVAPTSAKLTENPEAKLMRVETSGKPAENGWKDIRDIMERLEVQGMDPMIQRLANVKAAGINANEDKSRSMVESWIDAVNIAMRQIIQLNLKWMGHEVALDDIEYNINQDFVFATKTAQEVKDVIETRKNGDLSFETFIKEMQRYGRLSDGVDPEVERGRLDAEKGAGLGVFPAQGTEAGTEAAKAIIEEARRKGQQAPVGAEA